MTTRSAIVISAVVFGRALWLLVILGALAFLFSFGMSGMLAAAAILLVVKAADIVVSSANHHLPR